MEISIVVPVYNVADKLPKCIESVLSQEFCDFELILIDDGAKDESGKICDEYAKKDDRIVVIHKENGGVSTARNAGLDAAKGRYVAFVDGDDFIENYSLKKMHDAACAQNAQLVIGGYIYDKNGVLENNDCNVGNDLEENFAYLFEGYFLNPLWNKLFLREMLTERFEKGLSLGEDLLFNYAFMKNVNKIAVVDNMGYHYVMNDENSLTTIYRENAVKIAVLLAQKTNEFCDKAKNEVAKRCIDDVVNHIYKFVAGKKGNLKDILLEKYLLETDFSNVPLTKNQRIIVFMIQHKMFRLLKLYVKMIIRLR